MKSRSNIPIQASSIWQICRPCTRNAMSAWSCPSNLSLLPLELMACGVPVVSNRAPCTEWLLSDEIALLERPTVLALANAICTVLENPQEAQRLRAAGLKASAATDWAAEGMKMGKVLQTLDAASEPSAGQESLA